MKGSQIYTIDVVWASNGLRQDIPQAFQIASPSCIMGWCGAILGPWYPIHQLILHKVNEYSYVPLPGCYMHSCDLMIVRDELPKRLDGVDEAAYMSRTCCLQLRVPSLGTGGAETLPGRPKHLTQRGKTHVGEKASKQWATPTLKISGRDGKQIC
jgi:hypothetical protein